MYNYLSAGYTQCITVYYVCKGYPWENNNGQCDV